MKNLFLATLILLLIAPLNSYALQSAKNTIFPIPTTYDATGGSMILSETIGSHKGLQILNASTEVIVVSFANVGSAVPSSVLSTNPKQVFVPASGAVSMDNQQIPPRSRVYIRSDGSAVSSGVVRITLW